MKTALVTGTLLAALVTGGALTPASAQTPETDRPAPPPAIPGTPDVGHPGEDAGPQLEPTLDPDGNPVWPTDSHGPDTRSGWTSVVGVVDGARIRTTPVTGGIVGLIPHNAYYWISCNKKGADGYAWGYATHSGRYGWVRSDLWEVVQFTAPGAPAPRPIPWC